MGSGTEAPTGRDTRATLRPVLPWLVVMLVLGAAAVNHVRPGFNYRLDTVQAAALGVQRLEALPDPYPTHFDLSGEADGFSDRSLGNVLMPVVMGQLSGLLVFAMTLLPRIRGPRQPLVPFAALGTVIGGGSALISIGQFLSEDATVAGWTFWLYLAAIIAATVWVVLAALWAGSGMTINLGRPLGWVVLVLAPGALIVTAVAVST